MENFGRLPLDVIKLIIDSYYTPIISSTCKGQIFYLIIKYPTFSNEFMMPKTCVEMSRGSQWYSKTKIWNFIKSLEENLEDVLNFDGYFDMTIMLNEDNISIICENFNITIKNDELCRGQLIDVMKEYVEYLSDMEFYL